jgi:hypothetical protein
MPMADMPRDWRGQHLRMRQLLHVRVTRAPGRHLDTRLATVSQSMRAIRISDSATSLLYCMSSRTWSRHARAFRPPMTRPSGTPKKRIPSRSRKSPGRPPVVT